MRFFPFPIACSSQITSQANIMTVPRPAPVWPSASVTKVYQARAFVILRRGVHDRNPHFVKRLKTALNVWEMLRRSIVIDKFFHNRIGANRRSLYPKLSQGFSRHLHPAVAFRSKNPVLMFPMDTCKRPAFACEWR